MSAFMIYSGCIVYGKTATLYDQSQDMTLSSCNISRNENNLLLMVIMDMVEVHSDNKEWKLDAATS